MRMFSLLLVLWFAPVWRRVHAQEEGKYRVVVEKIDTNCRSEVSEVLNSVTVAVPIDNTEVKSSSEIYDFMLEELPFAAQCVRSLGKGKYEIFRGSELAKSKNRTEDEKARLHRTFYLDDKQGMFLKAERVHHEESRKVFYLSGYDDLSPMARIWGKAVIVIVFEKDEAKGLLKTEAKIFAKVEGVYGLAAKFVAKTAEDVARKKATLFVEAAKTIAEVSCKDPKGFVEKMSNIRDVDQKALERFKKSFVKE